MSKTLFITQTLQYTIINHYLSLRYVNMRSKRQSQLKQTGVQGRLLVLLI